MYNAFSLNISLNFTYFSNKTKPDKTRSVTGCDEYTGLFTLSRDTWIYKYFKKEALTNS